MTQLTPSLSTQSSADDWRPSPLERERQRYRRAQRYQSLAVSLASTLALAGAAAIGLNASPGWARVREAFFSPEYFIKSFPAVLQGLWLNVQVLFFALIGVALLGTLIAIVRTSRSAVLFPLRLLAQAYTLVMRGIPMIVMLYLIGFGIPGLGIFGRIPSAALGTIAIIMAYSAYVAEVLRAGFQDVHPSQRASARSLGLSASQTIWMIIIPQALRKVAPALMNDFISMQKDVGLISILGAVDAVRAAQIAVASTYNFTPYIVASVLFIALGAPFIALSDWYARRLRSRELHGGIV